MQGPHLPISLHVPAMHALHALFVCRRGQSRRNVAVLSCSLFPPASPPQLLGVSLAKRANSDAAGLLVKWCIILAAFVPPVCGQGGLQARAPWPAQGHDVGHSGRSPYSMGACPYGVAVRWSYTTGDFTSSSPAIGAEGTVYVGSADNNVYALNGSTGALLWKYTTGNQVWSSPAIGADGTVYVGSYDHKVYALNGSTGGLRWSYATCCQVYSSPAIGADGTVYVGTYDQTVCALNGSTGALLWRYATGNVVLSSPAIGTDGTVYVGSFDNRVYALNGRTGALLWRYATGNVVLSSPAIGTDGTVYVGSRDSKVYALHGSTGALRWNYTTAYVIDSSPAIGTDGTVYVGSYDKNLYALNGSTGARRWNYTTGYVIGISPAIAADGTVYVGSDDSKVYALNGSTGVLQWSYTTGSSVYSSPAIGADGTVYVGSWDKKVYALWCALPSPTPSPSQSPSFSYSTGVTPSASQSPMPSPTPSVSLAVSADVPPASGSAAPSPSLVQSVSESSSKMGSSSSSVTTSASVTVAAIPTISRLASITMTPLAVSANVPPASGSAAPSPSLLQSVSESSSKMGSSSACVTTSAAIPAISRLASITMTPTASISPSQFTISAMLQPLLLQNNEAKNTPHHFPAHSLLVADSIPASNANLTVSHCRAPCYASCNVSSVSVAVVNPSILSLIQADTSSPAHLIAVAVPVWAQFAVCPFSTPGASSAELACQVHSSSPPFDSAVAHLPIECLPTRWPLLADAVLLLLSSDQPDVVLKSAWGAPINVTSLLQDGTLPSLAAAVAHVSSQSQPIDTTGVTAFASLQSFMLPVSEKSRVALVARRPDNSGSIPPPFDNDTTVKLNNMVVPSIWLSNSDGDDTSSILIEVPTQASLCPSLPVTEDCGYLQLTITTSNVVDAATNSTVALGATLACPPFCPNDFPGTVPFATTTAADASAFTVMPATPQSNNAAPPIPIHYTTLPSTGLYMTSKCITGGFTDPLSGACTNSSNPRHAQCAFGAGPNCIQCPANALCPGGYRAWPTAGFYTAAESSGTILPCPPPSSDRCLGWNASASASQCGQAYLQGSFTCAACTTGFYPATIDGSCTPCPNGGKPSTLQILQPISVLVAAIIAICSCMHAGIRALAKARHADTSKLAKRTLQLAVWMWITLQNVAQIGQAASPGLPPIIASLYQQLAVLQFQGIAVPSVCIGGPPFLNEIVVMAAVLFGMLVLVSIAWRVRVAISTPSAKRGKLLSVSYKLAIIGLTVVYPTATNTVLGMLLCRQAAISASTYASLTGDYALIAAGGKAARSAVQVQVLLSDPSVLCYGSAHAPAASLAWVVVLLYCIGFPAAVVKLVGRRMRAIQGSAVGLPASLPSPVPSQCRTTCLRCHNRTGFEQLGSRAVTAPPLGEASPATRSTVGFWCTSQQQDKDVEDVTADKLLSPFVAGDYRASKYWFLAVDRWQFAALAILQAGCRNTAALGSLQLCGSVAVFAFAVCMLLFHQPYASSSRWKGYVRLYTYALCSLAACLNYATVVATGNAILPLAYLCFVGSVLLIVTLVVTFVYEALIHMPQPKAKPKMRVSVTGKDTRESQSLAWGAENPLHVKGATAPPDGRKSVDFQDGENLQLPAVGSRARARPSGVLVRAVRNSVAPFNPTQTRRKVLR